MQPKGRTLELRIERAFDQLNILPNIQAIRLEVRQARVRGKLVHCKKQPFDYLVITEWDVWGFDAKECSKVKWYPKSAPAHQVAAMRKMQAIGRRAGWVVLFTRFAGHPQALRYVEDLDSPVTMESGIAFDWEMFLQKESRHEPCRANI